MQGSASRPDNGGSALLIGLIGGNRLVEVARSVAIDEVEVLGHGIAAALYCGAGSGCVEDLRLFVTHVSLSFCEIPLELRRRRSPLLTDLLALQILDSEFIQVFDGSRS